jgi:hypothetical protein
VEFESALHFCQELMITLPEKLHPKMTVAYTVYYFLRAF